MPNGYPAVDIKLVWFILRKRETKLHHKRPIGRERQWRLGHGRALVMPCGLVISAVCPISGLPFFLCDIVHLSATPVLFCPTPLGPKSNYALDTPGLGSRDELVVSTRLIWNKDIIRCPFANTAKVFKYGAETPPRRSNSVQILFQRRRQ